MLDAFRKGGCFHSRTAMGMFDHVRKAVDKGDCLLEWDYKKGAQLRHSRRFAADRCSPLPAAPPRPVQGGRPA
jgi:hypothetical protein